MPCLLPPAVPCRSPEDTWDLEASETKLFLAKLPPPRRHWLLECLGEAWASAVVDGAGLGGWPAALGVAIKDGHNVVVRVD